MMGIVPKGEAFGENKTATTQAFASHNDQQPAKNPNHTLSLPPFSRVV